MPRSIERAVPLSLALQGGGAHGAYTWGVLDALLEAGAVRPVAASGASAGAINAVVLAQGLAEGAGQADGGAQAAREALSRFWTTLGEKAPLDWVTQWVVGPGQSAAEGVPALNPAAQVLMHWSQYLSPSQLNPLGLNPLRELLLQQIDFTRLRVASPLRLHIAATHALTGRLRLFTAEELSVEVVLASACLPTLQPAVMIEGEPYWDGGYSANPALFPLVDEDEARDVLIVMLSALRHPALPTAAAAIRERAVEIAFNASFQREARLLGEAGARARRRPWPWWCGGSLDRRLARLRWHLIDAQEDLAHLPSQTKLLPHLAFLQRLQQLGRARAQLWLAGPGLALGRSASVDLAEVFI
jgi:NTE family protein